MIFPAVPANENHCKHFLTQKFNQRKYSPTYIKTATQKYCSITTCLFRLETKRYTMKYCMILHRVRSP